MSRNSCYFDRVRALSLVFWSLLRVIRDTSCTVLIGVLSLLLRCSLNLLQSLIIKAPLTVLMSMVDMKLVAGKLNVFRCLKAVDTIGYYSK